MRMDNETYRLKVESLFDLLRDENDQMRPDLQASLEQMALSARKGRHFLRVVSSQPRHIQVHFYRYFMSRAQRDDAIADLERHIRHMFYEAREEAKAVLAEVVCAESLPAFFRVIALTEEGWLAGELIRIVLAAPGEVLAKPIESSLRSNNYLLQCLAIYLVGKSGNDVLLELLVDFYRKPEGEKLERLEKKAYDALMEGARSASPRLLVRWLKDKSSRVRDLAITLVTERLLPEAVPDLVGLLLVDPRTRTRAATALLAYEAAGVIGWELDSEKSAGARQILEAAKPGPLVATLRALLRDESPAVRELAVKLARLLPPVEEMSAQLRRLVTEDKATSVQIAAMHSLFVLDRSKLATALIELFSADAPSKDTVEAADALMEKLSTEETRAITQGIRTRLERREAALDRFVVDVEWWRHDT